MKYKGYTGVVELDEESGVLFGRVIGLRDVITFEGESVAEVTQAFRDSVDDYLEFCATRGESPEKPYSGQFVLRLDARLHRELAQAAEAKKTSLNALIESTLEGIFPTSAIAAKRAADLEISKHGVPGAGTYVAPETGRRKVYNRALHEAAAEARKPADTAPTVTKKEASAAGGAFLKKKR